MSRGNTDKCYCCGQVGHRRPDCPRRKETCSLCGKRGHLSHVCRSSGGNAALVATRASTSLCSATKLVNAGYSIQVRPTQFVLRRSGSRCKRLQRGSKRDFLSIRVRKSCEIHPNTFSIMEGEVRFLKNELRTLGVRHLCTSEVRLPWTPEVTLSITCGDKSA